ncbi:hypothetical protein RHP75_12300 [Pseudomonas sp. SG20056]|uniref:hypothetical protein n=1 Tax=Pseudomonas sp. SG20056 TaxID=3074146 RepID=UPI00287FCB0C|nr:hypothetical protein [Pseudomonas sp. SG20056]WNF45169.1 hypothetical protein RHP75_12300 [Pseudomonas sp. SG20056]
MTRPIATLWIALTLTGCAATHPKQAPVSFQSFTAPIGKPLSTGTGEDLFVEGAFIQGEKIAIEQDTDLMIPGSMMIPFPAHIGAGELSLTHITPDWKYFCGEPESVSASFPGLGSVIADGDCVGVRVSTTNSSKKEWVVDNSNHNGMSTIWTKSLSSEQSSAIYPVKSKTPFSVKNLKRIAFDGYFSGQLHFTWQEVSPGMSDSREFTFDFDGSPTVVGIKGNIFKVHKADNLSLQYEWVKIAR